MSIANRIRHLFSATPESLPAPPPPFPLTPPPPRPEPAYVFLSYSHKDAGLANQFAAYLAQEELPPWIDNQLQLGESWESVIFQRLKGSKIFMVLMSPHAAESEFIHREIDTALLQNKLIIPILISGDPFPKLAAYQHLSLMDSDHPRSRLIERLRDLLRPDQVPSQALQRRRIEHFVLPLFEMELEVATPHRLSLGIGFDKVFGVTPDEPLAGRLDELNWIEIFQIIRERLPLRNLHCPIGTDFDARFPTIRVFVDFLMDNLTWEEIRAL